MLQNKFLIGQTVVVMHDKKLVEMVVVSIDADEKNRMQYSLKHTSKPPKIKKAKPNAYKGLVDNANRESMRWLTHEFAMAAKYHSPIRLSGHNPTTIIVDDIDEPKEVATYHKYKETEIYLNKDAFLETVELVPVYVPKPKKEKIKA